MGSFFEDLEVWKKFWRKEAKEKSIPDFQL